MLNVIYTLSVLCFGPSSFRPRALASASGSRRGAHVSELPFAGSALDSPNPRQVTSRACFQIAPGSLSAAPPAAEISPTRSRTPPPERATLTKYHAAARTFPEAPFS